MNYRTKKPKVRYDHATGCWNWGQCMSDDYGSKWCPTRKRMIGAHRWTYELTYGPIPDGMAIDHLCLNKACVNPAHLEMVTHAENHQRALRQRTHADHAEAA